MALRSKPVRLLLIGLTALFVLIALITLVSVLIFDRVFLSILYKQLALVPGSARYDGWVKPSVPVYFTIYLFNITNLDEVYEGASPRFQEVGPFVYLERRERYDIQLSSEDPPKTVRFKHRIFYHYVPELTPVSPHIGQVTIPNLFYAGSIVSPLSFTALEEPFVKLSPYDAMWNFVPYYIGPNAGLFAHANGTTPREYLVHTGADDVSKVGKIIEANGATKLSVWDHEEANMINGTDGACAPPGMKVGSTVNFYVADICRSVVSYAVAKTQAVNMKEIELLVFSGVPPDPHDPIIDWRERIFCKSGYSCPPKGILSLQPCLAEESVPLPLMLSQPYFLGADPRIVAAFDQFPHPIPERHSTWVHIEPTTGFVLEAYKRIQFNLLMQNDRADYKRMAGPYYMPIGWVQESAVVDKATLTMLYEKLFVPRKMIPFILSIVGAVSTVISILLIIFVIMLTRRRSSSPSRSKRAAKMCKNGKDLGSKLGGSNDLVRIVQPDRPETQSSPQESPSSDADRAPSTQGPETKPLLTTTETVDINCA